MTPKEAANYISSGSNAQEVQKFLVSSTPRDLQEFLHQYSAGSTLDRHFNLARVALDIRLAEDATEQAKRFEHQMDKLLGITEAQRALAEKLDRQTETVISLTKALKWLTVVVVILTVLLLVLNFCDVVERHNQSRPESKPELKAGPVPITTPTTGTNGPNP